MKGSFVNCLTGFRALSGIILVVLFLFSEPWAQWAALLLFAVAAATDWLDGFLARFWDVRSGFGRMLDPIADKLLVAAGIVVMIAEGEIYGICLIPAVLILSREFFVSGLREHVASSTQIPVTPLAKWKTTIQLIALGLLFGEVAGPWAVPFGDIGRALLWVAAAVALWTGWSYYASVRKRVEAL